MYILHIEQDGGIVDQAIYTTKAAAEGAIRKLARKEWKERAAAARTRGVEAPERPTTTASCIDYLILSCDDVRDGVTYFNYVDVHMVKPHPAKDQGASSSFKRLRDLHGGARQWASPFL